LIRSRHFLLAILAATLAACASEPPPGPQTIILDRGLTLLERGPIAAAEGNFARSGGFDHAGITIQGPPGFAFDAVAHWRRNDGGIVTEAVADRRRVVTGPAGIATLSFTAPSADAGELMVEIGPAENRAPPQSGY
jgi:hypothetical protein